jgi:hypothetical protein
MIKEDKMWLGINNLKEFLQPDGTIKKFGNINWYTNLSHKKRNEDIILYKEYTELEYPKYDNYDAINVDKVKDIPKDYFKVIGVPITFLNKYNPEQFEILGCCEPCINLKTLQLKPNFKELKSRQILYKDVLCQKTYHRILIKRKSTGESFYVTPLDAQKELDDFDDYPVLTSGVIGVPITFLGKHNPEQFEIVGCSANGLVDKKYKLGGYKTYNNPFLEEKKVYQRIFIKNKNTGESFT